MEKLKNLKIRQNGITLIALIITIIQGTQIISEGLSITIYEKLALIEKLNGDFDSPYVNYTMKNGTTVLCQVLYNNGTNVEIIPVNPVDTLILGYSDDKVTQAQITSEKNTLPTFNSYMKYNGSYMTGTVDDYAKAKVSYNNAVTNLNSRAVNDYMNTSLSSSARCVGSNPSSPADNSGYYTNTSNYSYQTTYKVIGENYYKAEDSNYTYDFEQLGKIGALQITDSNAISNKYWLASRMVDTAVSQTFFYIRFVNSNGKKYDQHLCGVGSEGNAYVSGPENGFRPVFNLKSTVQVKNDGNNGTTEHPYNLETVS